MSLRIVVIGSPGVMGGASTELWHTLRLWRSMGLEITVVPTPAVGPAWERRLAEIGCRILRLGPGELVRYRRLPGRLAVAFCNRTFLEWVPVLRQKGMALVWAGCMNWLFPEEQWLYRRSGPMDAYIFQSRYQLRQLLPRLAAWGVLRDQCHLIRGAFFPDEFPFQFRPRTADEPLVLGRLCRPSADKFPRDFWQLFRQVDRPIRLRVMGWTATLQRLLGPPPSWADVLPPAAVPAQTFLASLHAMVAISGTAVENWPRVGLEAMACGVPVIAPALGGWPEMIRHGRTGLLFCSREEFLEQIRSLYDNDTRRWELAQAAYDDLKTRWADPRPIRAGWQRVFSSLTAGIHPAGR
jgi:glycosyltransferase involved in cell wall biosynthesis